MKPGIAGFLFLCAFFLQQTAAGLVCAGGSGPGSAARSYDPDRVSLFRHKRRDCWRYRHGGSAGIMLFPLWRTWNCCHSFVGNVRCGRQTAVFLGAPLISFPFYGSSNLGISFDVLGRGTNSRVPLQFYLSP